MSNGSTTGSGLVWFVDKQKDLCHVVMLHRSSTHWSTIPYFIERTIIPMGAGRTHVRERSAHIRLDPCAWLEAFRKASIPHVKLTLYRGPLLKQLLLGCADIPWLGPTGALCAVACWRRVKAFTCSDIVAKSRGKPYQGIGNHILLHQTKTGQIPRSGVARKVKPLFAK